MTTGQRIFPWCVVLLAGVYLCVGALPAKDTGPYRYGQLGLLPVSADGRVKPLDTVARNSLMILSDKQTLRQDGASVPAIQWLTDVIARHEQADEYPVFRIDHPGVLSLLGLKQSDGKRFSFNRIMKHAQTVSEQVQQARQVKPKQRDPYQKHVLELSRQLNLYVQLGSMQRPYMAPPLEPSQQWQPFEQAFEAAKQGATPHPVVVHLSAAMSSYQQQNPERFNAEVAQYRRFIQHRMPHAGRKAAYEVFFNQFEPFYHATVLYVAAFLIACFSFLSYSSSPSGWSRSLGRGAVWLLWLTLGLHTLGLASRIYLQGRPPVTNLYSSAVFVGWGAVLMALILERMHKLGLGSITAAIVGFTTLIVAHNLAGDGDTMEMMQAVLDSNFWLSTHVVAITIGYSATFLAGFLAILYILLGVFTTVLKPDVRKQFGQMVYGVVCFALLFSFVGTVLGGIWADQSWGRFWGWDPKENGAVLIVLMNALILHARWGGVIRQRGMMVLAVGGNIVTSWSWFGTNMLGVGLHSYGFMESAVFWLLVFVASQGALMGVGMLPLRWWRSMSAEQGEAVSKNKTAVPAVSP